MEGVDLALQRGDLSSEGEDGIGVVLGVPAIGDGFVCGLGFGEIADPKVLHIQVAADLASVGREALRIIRLGLHGLREPVDILLQLAQNRPNLLDPPAAG